MKLTSPNQPHQTGHVYFTRRPPPKIIETIYLSEPAEIQHQTIDE